MKIALTYTVKTRFEHRMPAELSKLEFDGFPFPKSVQIRMRRPL